MVPRRGSIVSGPLCVRVGPDGDVPGTVMALLEGLGGLAQCVRPGDTVLLKPNFVAPFADAVTDFRIIAAVADAVRAQGATPVVGESAGYEFDTAHTLVALGADDFCRDIGVQLVNLDEGTFQRVPTGDAIIGSLRVARLALEVETIINLPCLKRHSLTGVTFGMKNLMGLVHRSSRRRMHVLGIERGIAALNRVLRPALTVVDGLKVMSRAVYGVQRDLGILIGGTDVVAVDRVCCQVMGVAVGEVGHIPSGPVSDAARDIKPLAVTDERPASGWLYRAVFRLMYLLDGPLGWAFPTGSLIPHAHYWLGIRPHLNRAQCDDCGRCVLVCPVEAIDLKARRVIGVRCMKLRCLRCVDACPRGAIEVRGLRR